MTQHFDTYSMKHYSDLYRRELLDNILAFWIRNSKDVINAGYNNWLTREGSVCGTNKFMWLQGRAVWSFSTFYDKISPESDWIKMAKHGADYMIRHGRDNDGYWYFALSEKGEPLGPASDIFASCFACIGFAALFKIIPNPEYRDVALSALDLIIKEKNNLKILTASKRHSWYR
jgi:N-acylglucosamine 2-epimerase